MSFRKILLPYSESIGEDRFASSHPQIFPSDFVRVLTVVAGVTVVLLTRCFTQADALQEIFLNLLELAL